MYLLDTSIVSLLDPRRGSTATAVVDWIERNGATLFLSVITLAEMENGLLKLRRERKERRAVEIEALIDRIEMNFGSRILPIDAVIARTLSHVGAQVYPQNIGWPDLIIAATADVHKLIVLTCNIRHFQPTGVRVVDSLVELPPDAAELRNA